MWCGYEFRWIRCHQSRGKEGGFDLSGWPDIQGGLTHHGGLYSPTCQKLQDSGVTDFNAISHHKYQIIHFPLTLKATIKSHIFTLLRKNEYWGPELNSQWQAIFITYTASVVLTKISLWYLLLTPQKEYTDTDITFYFC